MLILSYLAPRSSQHSSLPFWGSVSEELTVIRQCTRRSPRRSRRAPSTRSCNPRSSFVRESAPVIYLQVYLFGWNKSQQNHCKRQKLEFMGLVHQLEEHVKNINRYCFNGTITKESLPMNEFISVVLWQMAPLCVKLHTARGCNDQSLACPGYNFSCSAALVPKLDCYVHQLLPNILSTFGQTTNNPIYHRIQDSNANH